MNAPRIPLALVPVVLIACAVMVVAYVLIRRIERRAGTATDRALDAANRPTPRTGAPLGTRRYAR